MHALKDYVFKKYPNKKQEKLIKRSERFEPKKLKIPLRHIKHNLDIKPLIYCFKNKNVSFL